MDGNTTAIAPKVVNGINLDDLFALIGRVKSEPGSGTTKWRVATTWQGQTRSRAEVEGFGIGGELVRRPFSIDIDEPLELGGSNRFANPQEHLIAALNACMTVGYVAQCAVRGITLESLAIETEGEIDLRGVLGIDPAVPPGYENLRYTCASRETARRHSFTRFTRPSPRPRPISTTCPGRWLSNRRSLSSKIPERVTTLPHGCAAASCFATTSQASRPRSGRVGAA